VWGVPRRSDGAAAPCRVVIVGLDDAWVYSMQAAATWRRCYGLNELYVDDEAATVSTAQQAVPLRSGDHHMAHECSDSVPESVTRKIAGPHCMQPMLRTHATHAAVTR
jgi:hypothetical protein